ncbi:hypothetical protein TNCV_1600851 [Trichonephila clavipes]|nr:hypothetical protein TNCV_1600851 [Trichonephila clavipes]
MKQTDSVKDLRRSSRPRVSEETVEHVRQSFLLNQASRELQISPIVWLRLKALTYVSFKKGISAQMSSSPFGRSSKLRCL